MGKEGADDLAAFSILNVEYYAREEQSGAEDGGGVSTPHRVEGLVGAVIFMASFTGRIHGVRGGCVGAVSEIGASLGKSGWRY